MLCFGDRLDLHSHIVQKDVFNVVDVCEPEWPYNDIYSDAALS